MWSDLNILTNPFEGQTFVISVVELLGCTGLGNHRYANGTVRSSGHDISRVALQRGLWREASKHRSLRYTNSLGRIGSAELSHELSQTANVQES
jgi:hypothetical protein